MTTYRVMQVAEAGGPIEPAERELGEPGPGTARVHVRACGICHSDAFVKEATYPAIVLPRVPGHEVAGVVDALGPGCGDWMVGDRVGVGWYGGHCTCCGPCRRGDFVLCQRPTITGITTDGGYGHYLTIPAQALARIPAGLDFVEAAPLMCAGITTFNALRNAGARGGDLVAVQGVGGLGHLAIQFASRLGFETVALSRGVDKARLARQLGAAHVVDTAEREPAAALQRLGGAKVILATSPSGASLSGLVGGLANDGRLVVAGAGTEPMQVVPVDLIMGRRSVSGWPSGVAAESEDTLDFSDRAGIRPIIETFPLSEAGRAYDRMMSNEAPFRVVLAMQ